MIRILILLNGIGLDGITDSVLSYMETIKEIEMIRKNISIKKSEKSSQEASEQALNIMLGFAGAFDKKVTWRMKNLGMTVRRFPDRQKNTLQYFQELLRYIKQNQIHVVHAHGNSATLAVEMTAARLGGCEIRLAHCHNTSCTHPFADQLLRPLFYRNYTHGLACGKKAGKWLFQERPFILIPNGQDISRFLFNPDARKSIRMELGLRDDEFAIGHVGNFSEAKNHRFVIDIFREVHRRSSQHKLYLFGDGGSEKAKVMKKITDCGLDSWISLEGFKTDIENYLSAMDIMVLPSLYEGLPNVMIQYQISGLPVLFSDKITQECQVTNFAHRFPLAIGAEKWAQKIIKLSKRDRDGEQESIRNIMTLAGFNINQNAENLSKTYRKLYKKIYKNKNMAILHK